MRAASGPESWAVPRAGAGHSPLPSVSANRWPATSASSPSLKTKAVAAVSAAAAAAPVSFIAISPRWRVRAAQPYLRPARTRAARAAGGAGVTYRAGRA
ncbi:hypothetical protein GCM10023405_11450 [Streptomonospora salina]